MRFAYIDSQGKEVGIPTVEALQLRIELGAITEETMFYDASKDRWDPAGEHEIFRTLSREIRERDEDGPRPPTPKVITSEDHGGEEVDAEDAGSAGAGGPGAVGESREEAEGRPRAPDPFEREQSLDESAAGTGDSGEAGWVDAELEDVREAPGATGDAAVDPGSGTPDAASGAGASAEPPTRPAGRPRGGPGGEPPLEPGPDRVPTDPGDVDPDDAEPDAGDEWDLGDFGELDLAPELEAEGEAEDAGGGATDTVEGPGEAEGSPEPEDAVAETAGDPSEERDAEDGDERPPPTFQGPGGDLELERPLAEQHGGESSVADDDMPLETPFSEAQAGAGAWDETPGTAPGGASGAPGPEGSAPEEGATPPVGAPERGRRPGDEEDDEGRVQGEEGIRRERRRRDPYDRRVQRPERTAPRSRRRPSRRRRKASAGRIAAVAALVAVAGVGGWYGWSSLQGADGGGGPDDAVMLPPLPAELEGAMREVADSAWNDAVDSLRAMAARADLPAEPNPDWLAGVYLANAGDYPEVAAYWEALQDHLGRIRAADEELFRAALDRRLASSGIPPESRDTVAARARAGFRAAAPGREIVYGGLENLIAVASDLHRFLVGNQANIAYEPAVGMSRDPVTEAVPASPALAEEMRSRVVEIPNALEALGTLDRVTTQRILEQVHRRLDSVAIR